MSPRLLLAALAPAVLLSSGCGTIKGLFDPPMAEFVSPDGKWKAKFPGKPNEQSKPGPMGITFTMFLREPWGNKGGYMVAFADLPIPAGEPDHVLQKRLDDGVTGATNGVGGKLKDNKRVFLHGRYPGREFAAAITEPKVGQYRCRMYVVGTRMYQVAVMGVDEFVNTPKTEEFLNSFELVGETAPAHAPEGVPNPAERLATAPPGKKKKAAPPPDEPIPAPAGGVVHSTGGKYKARFPADPTKGSVTAAEVTYSTQTASADGATFAVGYAEVLSLDGQTQKQRQAALDAARDAIVAETGASQPTRCELVNLAGRYRGWEFAAGAGAQQVRGRVYLVGNRLYRVTVRGSAEAVRDGGPAAAFLDSFALAD